MDYKELAQEIVDSWQLRRGSIGTDSARDDMINSIAEAFNTQDNKKTKSATQILIDHFVGKKLINLEFGCNDGEGSRIFERGSEIMTVSISIDRTREDPKICLGLSDDCTIEVYSNEDIEVE